MTSPGLSSIHVERDLWCLSLFLKGCESCGIKAHPYNLREPLLLMGAKSGCSHSVGRASVYEFRSSRGEVIQSITTFFFFFSLSFKDKIKVFSVFLIHMLFLSATISARRTQQACCGWKKDTVNCFSWWEWHARWKARKIWCHLSLFPFPLDVACPICNCLFIARPSPDGWLLLTWMELRSGNNRGDFPGPGGLLSVEISPVLSNLVFVQRPGGKDQGSTSGFLPSC